VSALRILVTLDFAKPDKILFDLINSLATHSDVEVTLLQVISWRNELAVRETRDSVCSQVRRELLGIERRFLSPGVESRATVRISSLWEGVSAEARRIQADWIVVTSDALPGAGAPLRASQVAAAEAHTRVRNSARETGPVQLVGS
jgi:hypothetical protein